MSSAGDGTLYRSNHAAPWSCQDAGVFSARSGHRPGQLPRPASCSSVPHSVLSTVVTHCAPPIRGEDDDFRSPLTCTPPLLVSIKGGDGHHLLHDLIIHTHVTRRTHTRSLEPRYCHSPQSSSRDLGASLPLSPRLYPLLQAPPVQDSTVHSHTLAGRTAPRPEPG